MRQDLGDEARRPLEAPRDVRRRREETRRLAERAPVELLHLPAESALLGCRAELPEVGAVQLVGLPELVHEPHTLLTVPDDVGRELRRHHDVDRAAVRLFEIEHPPEERLGQHAGARVPLERDRDEIRLVAARAQLRDELVREDLGAPARERHLRPEDGDPHPAPASAGPRRDAARAPPRVSRRAARGRRPDAARRH